MRNRIQYSKIKKNLEGKRYLTPLKYPLIPFKQSDLYVTTTAGDRIDSLAELFYGDVRLWWIITTANKDIIKRDSLGLKPGTELRIPQAVENILSKFEIINK